MENLTPKYNVIPSKEKVVSDMIPFGNQVGGMKANSGSFFRGKGNDIYMVSEKGIHLGAADFVDAPFSVDMQGNLVATSGTFSGSITGASGNFSGTLVGADITGASGTFTGSLLIGGVVITITDINDLQPAINDVSDAGGGIVNLAPGTYSATANITVPSNVTLQGDGATIDFGGGAFQIQVVGSNAYSTGTVAVSNDGTSVVGTGTTWTAAMVGRMILLEDFWYEITARADNTHITIGSPYLGTTLSGAAYNIATTVDSVSLKGFVVQNSSVALIKLQYNNNIHLENIFGTEGLVGVDADDGSGMNVFSVAFDSCGTGFTFDNFYYGIFWNSNVSNSSSGGGIIFNKARNWGLEIFACQNITGNGMSFTSCSNMGVENFSLREITGKAVELVSGNSDFSFEDGTISNVSSDGFKLTATSDRIQIQGQAILNCTGFGINIAASSCDNNIISGNNFLNNTAGNISDSGTGTIRIGNSPIALNTSTVNISGDQTITDIKTFASTVLTSTDINGGTVDGVTIGGSSAGAITGTTITASTGFALGDGDYVGVTSNETLVFNTAGTIVVTGADLLVADGNGFVIGHSAQLAIGGVTAESEQFGTAAADGTQALGMFNATAGTQAEFMFYRSKNASVGSATVVASADGLGKITWYGAQQTGTFATQNPAAQIRAEVDGTVTSGAGADMPGRLVFATTPDGSGTLTTALTIFQNQTATFVGDVTVPDEVYGSGWNGSLEVPTKNAVYDKIETIGIFKSGQTSRTASGSFSIAHGAGVTPKLIKITAMFGELNTAINGISVGSATGTGAQSASGQINRSGSLDIRQNASNVIYIVDNGSSGYAVGALTTLDATNITIDLTSFTGSGLGSPVLYIQWEAWA